MVKRVSEDRHAYQWAEIIRHRGALIAMSPRDADHHALPQQLVEILSSPVREIFIPPVLESAHDLCFAQKLSVREIISSHACWNPVCKVIFISRRFKNNISRVTDRESKYASPFVFDR